MGCATTSQLSSDVRPNKSGLRSGRPELCSSGNSTLSRRASRNHCDCSAEQKSSILGREIEFSGQTEYIAELCGFDQTHMMLINDQLSVIHVSTHCSLHDVTKRSVNCIIDTIRRGYEAFLSIRHKEPRVAVCRLNPHAGENEISVKKKSSTSYPPCRRQMSTGLTAWDYCQPIRSLCRQCVESMI